MQLEELVFRKSEQTYNIRRRTGKCSIEQRGTAKASRVHSARLKFEPGFGEATIFCDRHDNIL